MSTEQEVVKRKKLIQLVHIGKAQLGMDDDTYRALLIGVCGKDSAAAMTERQLAAVLKVMRKSGFAAPARRVQAIEQGRATQAQLEYIKGMWAACARNKSDAALLAFVARIAHVKSLRFLTVRTAQAVILAIRDMMVKAGFDPDTSEACNGPIP
jgi:hypothetical protein